MGIIKEACVGSYLQAKEAYELGADRIELCINLGAGGTTPTYGTIALAKETIPIDINVMIRPWAESTMSIEDEIKIMEKDIDLCKKLGVHGVVLGALTKDNDVDEELVKRFIRTAGELSITFHMAFDRTRDQMAAIDKLVELGVDRILTRGGQGSAVDNQPRIKKYVEYAGDRIIILPGGGVTKENYGDLVTNTGVKEVHGSKIMSVG